MDNHKQRLKLFIEKSGLLNSKVVDMVIDHFKFLIGMSMKDASEALKKQGFRIASEDRRGVIYIDSDQDPQDRSFVGGDVIIVDYQSVRNQLVNNIIGVGQVDPFRRKPDFGPVEMLHAL